METHPLEETNAVKPKYALSSVDNMVFVLHFRADDFPALEVLLTLSGLHTWPGWAGLPDVQLDYCLRWPVEKAASLALTAQSGSGRQVWLRDRLAPDSMVQLFLDVPKEVQWVEPIMAVLRAEGEELVYEL